MINYRNFNLQKISMLFFTLLIFTNLLGGGIFDPKGAIALAEKNLIITSVLLMLIVIIPVFILTFYFAYKYRENNTKATYAPEWSHSTKLEFVWWGIPILIILALGIITWKSSHDLDPYKPLPVNGKEPIVIQVVSLNWKWLFIYPNEQIATLNYLNIPKDTPIAFLLTSDAPMNSFWIPQLSGQIYTMPGMETKLHIIANENGKFEGMSANYSGYGFSGMGFIVEASSTEDYNKWVSKVKSSSSEILDNNTYIKLAKFSLNDKIKTYSSVKPKLFYDILMKYMSPNKSELLIDIMSESKKYNSMEHLEEIQKNK